MCGSEYACCAEPGIYRDGRGNAGHRNRRERNCLFFCQHALPQADALRHTGRPFLPPLGKICWPAIGTCRFFHSRSRSVTTRHFGPDQVAAFRHTEFNLVNADSPSEFMRQPPPGTCSLFRMSLPCVGALFLSMTRMTTALLLSSSASRFGSVIRLRS